MPSNTDEFRAEALRFQELGYYCKHDPKSISGRRYWIEQARRSIEGYNIGRDWIPGYFYWYLNFCQIPIAEADDEILLPGADAVRGERVMDFPDFWDGDYDYFHYLEEAEERGLHAAVIKTRRRGYSYKGGAMLNRNFYLIPNSKSYAVAAQEAFLLGDGLLTKAWSHMDFVDTHTPFGKRRQYYNTKMHRRASKQEKRSGIPIETGYMSEIMGVTLKDDPDKIRGKAGKLMLWEESGSNRHLLRSWNTALPAFSQDRITYGLMIAFGTGGDDASEFMSLEELFFKGSGYKVHMIPNVWSKHAGKESTCGYFASDYKNRQGHIDKDGNSDIVGALAEIEEERAKVKEESKNPQHYTRWLAEHPITPEEATMRVHGNTFPVKDLKEVLARVEANPKTYAGSEWVGVLVSDHDNKTFKWQPDPDVMPINNFPLLDDSNIDGGIVIYEQPIKATDTGRPFFGRYISGCDPVDDDWDPDMDSESLLSAFILDTFTDRIVAEYSGRPESTEIYYENLRRLLIYYNALCNYEQNKKGLYSYLGNRNCEYLLADTPAILREQGITDFKGSGNRSKGTMASTPVKTYGKKLINSWMLRKAYGEDEDSGIRNLDKIRSIPLLKEAIYYSPKGNYDRIDALAMVMILREDRVRITERIIEKRKKKTQDKFFSRNLTGNKSYDNDYFVKVMKDRDRKYTKFTDKIQQDGHIGQEIKHNSLPEEVNQK